MCESAFSPPQRSFIRPCPSSCSCPSFCATPLTPLRQTKEERENIKESHLKTEMLESLQRLPISFGMALRTREKCRKVAEELVAKGDYLTAMQLSTERTEEKRR